MGSTGLEESNVTTLKQKELRDLVRSFDAESGALVETLAEIINELPLYDRIRLRELICDDE